MWKLTEDDPMQSGDIGGDIQRGEAWSRRLVWCDDTGRPLEIGGEFPAYAVIEDAYYAVDVKDITDEESNEPIVYDVQNQIWRALCTNPESPGDTEIWSDYSYDFVEMPGTELLERATQAAWQACANASTEHFSDPSKW